MIIFAVANGQYLCFSNSDNGECTGNFMGSVSYNILKYGLNVKTLKGIWYSSLVGTQFNVLHDYEYRDVAYLYINDWLMSIYTIMYNYNDVYFLFFQTTTRRECCVGLRGGGYAQAGAETCNSCANFISKSNCWKTQA